MTAVLALDGGQSGIRARHSGSNVAAEVAGVSRQEGDTIGALVRATASAWNELGSPVVHRAVLGLTTAPTDESGRERLASAVALAIGADEVWVCDDTVTVHAGALAGGWGVTLRAGTGVACLAVGERGGEPIVVDGHGYLLGDDGAAFWIGREALRAVLRSSADRGDTNGLATAAEERFGGLDDLHVRVHDHPRPVNEIAQFSRDVAALAADGDAVATAILTAAAEALAATVSTAVVAIAGSAPIRADIPTARVPVAIGGRLIEESALLHDRLVASIALACPAAAVRDAEGGPLDGGLGLGAGTLPDRYGTRIHHWRRAPSHE